jgi:hypothetical protein
VHLKFLAKAIKKIVLLVPDKGKNPDESKVPVDDTFSYSNSFLKNPPTGPPDIGQTILHLDASQTTSTQSSLDKPPGPGTEISREM